MKKHVGLRNSAGYTMVEMIVALTIAMAIALSTMVIIQNSLTSSNRMDSRQALLEATNFVRANLNHQGNNFDCSHSMTFPNAFQPGGQTPVVISADQVYLADNTKVAGAKPFMIRKIYLGNAEQVATNGTETTYVVGLFIEASVFSNGGFSDIPRAELATLVVNVGSAGQLLKCDMGEIKQTTANLCNSIAGMQLNPQNHQCQEVIGTGSNHIFSQCPSGLAPNADGSCSPPPSRCSDQQVAAGFNSGIVTNCASPAGFTVASDPDSVPDAPPAPTTCVCGAATVQIGGYCASCDQETPLWTFSPSKYNYQVYKCGTDGNLSPATTYRTSTQPPGCNRKPSPAAGCDSNGNGCYQGAG